MLKSTLIILALCAVACHAGVLPAFGMNSIPGEYKDLVPPEVTNFYNELTKEDKHILKEIAAQHDIFQNEDQVLEVLKAKSEKLYNKFVELRNLVKGKIDALNPEAKEFVTGMREQIEAFPTMCIQEIIKKYEALSEEAKRSVKNSFPGIEKILH